MRFPLSRFFLSSALSALFAAAGVQAQTLGTITGEVRDATGAIVPAAAVTVLNTATNGIRNATTNEQGIYSIPALNPGIYEARAEKEGFKAATRRGIELQVQQTARIDFALEIGEVSETVEVTGAPPLLTTENATVGTVVEERRITDLPLNGRSFFSLVALSPNVTFGFTEPQQAAGRQGGTRSQLTISLAGSRSTWSNYTLDGIANTDVNFNLYIMQPSVEALQEFKVQTGVYPAEFGRAAGQVNVMTKGGGNQFHGSAFEFLRNDKLDATPYFFKDPDKPQQTAPDKPPYRQNQYGFTVSGPVVRDKLFFMANWEGFKSRTASTNFFTSMTPAMRSGDFSVVTSQLSNPYTTVNNGGVITREPFVNNQIPQNLWSPGSLYLLENYAPLPNQAQSGLPSNNYEYTISIPVDKNNLTGRIDFNESVNSQWFGRYSWTDETLLNPGVQLNGTLTLTHAHQFVVANTRVFSPTKVNEFRVGYNSMFNNITTELAGVENVNEKLNTSIKVDDPNSWGIPDIGIGGGISGFGNGANGPFTIDDKIYQVVDNYSWVAGKHTFRVGGEWRYNQFKQIGNEFARTRFTSNGQFTGDPTNGLRGGYNAADFLMGAFSSIEGAVDLAKGDFRGTELAFYVDHTYKATPHLTINLGMRWEFAQPYLDKFGNEPNIQLQQPLPNVANVQDRSLHPVLVRTGQGDYYDDLSFRYSDATLPLARDGRLGDRMINNDWNNYAPRIGIAYSPSDKWAFRTGVGIFYSQESKNSIFDLNRAIAGRTNPPITTSGVPLLSYSNYVDASSLPAKISTGLVWGVDNDIATTYVMQYLFNVQRTIGQNSTLEVGYTGNLGRKLAYLVNPNSQIPSPDANASDNSLEPYPEWAGMQFVTGDGNSNYNALSGKFSQRFGTGLTTTFAYTWSKSLDVLSAIRGNGQFTVANQRCRKCNFGPSGFNVPHRFVSSVLYSIPLGQGFSHANSGVLKHLIGGWQISAITTIQSGSPLNADSGWDAAKQGKGFPHSNRSNCLGIDPYASNPTTDQYFAGSFVNGASDQRFVPTAFQNLLPGTFGTCGRNNMIGPSRWNVDFSALKDFPITERQTLQFRMEMFNAPNHPAWGSPSLAWGNQNLTTANVGFGRIRSTSQLRQIQFALKYFF
jgi:hypothetical protein